MKIKRSGLVKAGMAVEAGWASNPTSIATDYRTCHDSPISSPISGQAMVGNDVWK